ncbi:uncharacterized protein SETTUDRAFT_38691 [Exserohilum turcica Et28A]|uniref:Uncharacterized protein n=1 Tax=Exserohilum turcicum (strain 28A) TaxID=671987 RepID=R0K6Q1_EXST2|nr:uncharacterized protein SETTUDRAFT_38691 [Exserohilum turcica Et28A]EOA88653.1 hypothetical protein SETTUDRAFT_38691 [Exserohilum turcica Et28A]
MLFLLLYLLFGFSVCGTPLAPEGEPDFSLYFDRSEIDPYMRNEDGEHALHQAVTRRLDDHFRTDEAAHALHVRGLNNKRASAKVTVYYRPNLNDVCIENGLRRVHAAAYVNVCINPRQFSVICDIDEEHDEAPIVYGNCSPGYFCVTVLKDTLTVVDPANLHIGQAVEPICTQEVKLDIFKITESLLGFVSEWWRAPGKFKVFFGRMALQGQTLGTAYNLRWDWKTINSKFGTQAGFKRISDTSSATHHEYEMSYDYNYRGDMQFRAAVDWKEPLGHLGVLTLLVYFAAISPK